MLAIAAAVAFALALLLDLTTTTLGDSITAGTLTTVGLLLVALHLAGVGTGARSFNFRRRGRR
ncbi:hypothetical protein F3087_07545 [Nocardia colli]|uniref:Uncharacterized protein n=1 Tax=Nocardia colli TaxID=2545717 RepID=A0A5N0EIP3_9NOCA|nr:hypothetical protein [Nocardia colli]KAA8888853.1 hypothetical protein F3087_07545 [Nocardia colli]